MWAIKHGISERAIDSPLFKIVLNLAQRLPASKDAGEVIQTRKTRNEVIVDALYEGVLDEMKRDLDDLNGAFSATSDAWTSFHSQNK